MPSLLITGAAGMLGCDTVTTLQPAYKLLPFSQDAQNRGNGAEDI